MLTWVWNSAAIVVKITRSPHTLTQTHSHTHTLLHSAMQPKLNRAENEMENIAMRKAAK